MIIATAGHVDHGKTSLVQALTGIDTDRLREEKARGLTIDLGFAYTDTSTGERLGFIDVPGHIKFISNMLSGIGAIDFALLVVAADDGPMPQTREHLAILDLLGIHSGAVALTKTDRVDEQRVSQVEAEIQQLLATTGLHGANIYPVSAIAGSGIDVLESALSDAAREFTLRNPDGHFRLAIDRCFTVKGSGIVVTGSVFSGSVGMSDELYLQPAGQPVRVRGIHAQNTPADIAQAGDRAAINIAGANLDREAIHRGNWLTSDAGAMGTRRFDVQMTVLESESRPLRHWTPVHIHTAASHVTGRAATLEGRSIAPGVSALVQLVASEPLVLCFNDKVIIRDQAAERTVGGGIVVDPNSPQRGRADPLRVSLLRGLPGKDKRSVLRDLLAHSKEGVATRQWQSALNLTADEFERMAIDAVSISGKRMISTGQFEALSTRLLEKVTAYQQANRSSPGLTLIQLARAAAISDRVLADHLIDALVSKGKLTKAGGKVTLPGQRGELSEKESVVWTQVEPLLRGQLTKPPVLHDIADNLHIPIRELEKTLGHCVQLGYLVRPVQNRFFLPEAMQELLTILMNTADERDQLSVRQYRDATGIGRNLAIEILEYFDRQGITRRVGDTRSIIKRPAPRPV